MYSRRSKSKSYSTGNTIINLIIFVAFILVLFWLARSVFTILSWLAPFMLIVALILDYKVVLNYIKTLWRWLRYKTLIGVVAVLFTIFGFPLVSAYLLVRAIASRQSRKSFGDNSPPHEFIDYEEIEEEILDLPDLNRAKEELN